MMETSTKRITDEQGNCYEVATITHLGHEYSAGGACMWHDDQGKIHGILYTGMDDTYLQNWSGEVRVACKVGSTWEGNFLDYHGRRQVNKSYYFTINGRKCRGVNYNRNWQQIVRFKEI